jgi:hypothetical protein
MTPMDKLKESLRKMSNAGPIRPYPYPKRDDPSSALSIITQHTPDFVEGDEDTRKVAHFSDLASLLRIEWVKRFTKVKNFHQLSINLISSDHCLLIAEYKGGKEWYVVGYITQVGLGLPIWKPSTKISRS